MLTSFFSYPQIGLRLRQLKLSLLRKDMEWAQWCVRRLRRQNLRSTASIVAPGGPVVSLTTYGMRLESVFLTIESIAAGDMLPSRLILWIESRTVWEEPPPPLKRLIGRGLELRLTEGFGPHTKYYPLVSSEEIFHQPLVTADDDAIYSKWWLSGLVAAHRERPDLVNCYRSHVVTLENGTIRPYLEWDHCSSTVPSYVNFATGVSGCIYPVEFLGRLREAGTAFLGCCPGADDVWLHVNAVRHGFRIRQINVEGFNFPILPGTQTAKLSLMNVAFARNDLQIGQTYRDEDIAILLSDRPSCH